ncbi:type VI secretion system-associated FHA domain protein TagH [Roseibium sediminis]|uniref:type VI secretion system-associated FHA domain protein TagH n=1 Tax=Roseibium sediminis TaxID=1775174 RepID=UPI00123D9D76|nr:type VI secretion system-associated FHA domain protein TagH [Roseibium sediminis]
MKMILAVNNTTNLESGIAATSVFEASGGVIGSAPDADWQLMDRAGSVADFHVKIFQQDGHFCATPLDREGMIVNRSSRPMRPGSTFSVSDGDTWNIGDFNVSVYIAESEKSASGGKTPGEQWAGQFSSIETLVPGSLQNDDRREQLNAEAILADYSEADDEKAEFFATRDRAVKEALDPITHLNKVSQSLEDDSTDPVALFDRKRGTSSMSDDKTLIDDLNIRPQQGTDSLGLDDPMAQNAHFSGPRPTSNGEDLDSYLQELTQAGSRSISQIRAREEWHDGVKSGNFDEDQQVDHVVLRPLLNAMGLPVSDMSVPEANRVARETGEAMLAAIIGLMEIHNRQGGDRNSLNDTHLHPVEDNPLRLGMTPGDAVRDLFLVQSPVHLNAPAAIEESLAQITAHEEASQTAIEAALDAVLGALSPAQLSRRFARYKGHAPKSGDADAWHWQMYQHYYSEMKSDRQRGLGRMFWEIFRQVYDREMRSKTLESQFGSASVHDL